MLTKIKIEKTPPGAELVFLWDNELPGFGCIVRPTGLRSFVVQYRLRGRSGTVRQSLGTYGAVTLVQARKRAADILAQAKAGLDPQADTKARRAASCVVPG